MSRSVGVYNYRIQRKTNPGDKRFIVNTFDFTLKDRRVFFHSDYCYKKKYDYVLLDNGKIKIGLQHQHIAKNIMDSVIAAGSLIVNNTGFVEYLDNQSGTFQFSGEEQQNYIGKLHTVLNLQNAEIYNVDYTTPNYDPQNPVRQQVDNKFYSEIGGTTIDKLEFIKDIEMSKWKWLLTENKFDHELYAILNEDLSKMFNNKALLYQHFYLYGQYEMGRCIGFY
tara:strand:- start:1759 stop:2427 length:669 start_codon:yes stop_codon:yes gene_type:complete